VVRSVDGVTNEGRFIEPDAYALYAVAALREARGQWNEALSLYQRISSAWIVLASLTERTSWWQR